MFFRYHTNKRVSSPRKEDQVVKDDRMVLMGFLVISLLTIFTVAVRHYIVP
jgi:hypothetical protein